MKKFVYLVFVLFSFLGVLFIPFSFRNLEFQSKLTAFLFEDLILFLASRFDSVHIVNAEISSDSTTLYGLFGILFTVAILLAILLLFFKSLTKHKNFIVKSIQLILIFYLSGVMLKYGFDKIFKVQFYLPEPNILFTPLGFLDKDILYWSTMGSSYSYTVFMGVLEVISALLLLFRHTRVLALLLLSGILLNVVFINFGFDISVKLYSLFLLLLCLLLLVPTFKTFFYFFILNKRAELPKISGENVIVTKHIRYFIKVIVILFIFIESLYPYIQSGNFNDDQVPRMELHGAYEVIKTVGTSEDGSEFSNNVKRIFIHRHSYFILQYEDDTMEDYYLQIIPTKNELVLTDYDGEKMHILYSYAKTTKRLELNFSGSNLVIYSEAIPWKELPLLQPLFHWTVDEIK